MGTRGKPRTRRGRKAATSTDAEQNNNNNSSSGPAGTAVPDCVRVLRESTTYGELEEACADVGLFAAEAAQHARLVELGVAQRLMQLLLTAQPPSSAAAAEHASGEAAEGQSRIDELHKGWLYVQIAAAEALHSMISHSSHDEVIDGLVAEAGDGAGLGNLLLRCLHTLWQRGAAQEAAWRLTLTNNNNNNNNDTQSCETDGHATERQSYFVLLRLLTEVLRLIAACVEGSERVAEAMSTAEAVQLCGAVLRQSAQAMTTALTADPTLYAESRRTAQEETHEEEEEKEDEEDHDDPRHTAVELSAGVALATAELLHVLSADNAALARLLTSDEGGCAAVHATLNELLAAATVTPWLAAHEPATSAASLAARSSCALRREYVGYALLHLTLLLQATLVHVTAASAESIQRVLPLLTATLRQGLPIALWCDVAWPLLLAQCALPEGTRGLAVRVTTERLRCTHVAGKLLHSVVNAICEQNARGEDDEVAFRANPLSALLYAQHTLAAFALVLRDLLWLDTAAGGDRNGGGGDVMQGTRRAAQQALHALTEHNAEARTLQSLLLRTEVVVWEVANTLLLMVPVAQLGAAAVIWRAMVQTLSERYALLRAAIAGSQDDVGPGDATAQAAYARARQTGAARRLLWLQAEALAQMLWTLQRKQAAQRLRGDSDNGLAATAADVDLLTRLSWEPEASLALRQACVGAVGLLCGSLASAEAVTVAARYALAVLRCSPAMSPTQQQQQQQQQQPPQSPPLHSSSSSLTLLQLEDGLVQNSTNAPTEVHARRAWLGRLGFVDQVVSLRCEAANTLIDLFLDERYDAAVYVPLGVHAALRAFLPQLRAFLKRREQLARDCRRHHRLELECEAAENWAELEENLAGFLDYKAQTCKLS